MLMKLCLPRIASVMLLAAALTIATSVQADSGPVITDGYADVNGLKLHYLVAGKGDPDPAPWLRTEQSYVASIDEGTGKNAPRGGA